MANLSFRGVIKSIGPVQEFKTQRGEMFMKRELELEEVNVQYPCSMVVELTGDNAQYFNGVPGQTCEAFIDCHTSTYNGRKYNNLRCWRYALN